MPDASSFWQTTCSAIRAGAEPGWEAIAPYREPLLLFLAARYPWVPPPDREDLVHEILVDLREGLARRYEADRGPFRAFLCGVVRNKVLSRWKRARRERAIGDPAGAAEGDAGLAGEPPPPTEEEGLAIDVVASVVGAVQRWHDRQVAGGPDALRRLYVLAGRLVRGESYKEIAAREEISPDAVKRILTAAREEIVADLLERTLPLSPAAKAGLDWRRLAGIAARALAEPRRRARTLAEVGLPELRDALAEWIETLERARRGMPEDPDLLRGLGEIFRDAAA